MGKHLSHALVPPDRFGLHAQRDADHIAVFGGNEIRGDLQLLGFPAALHGEKHGLFPIPAVELSAEIVGNLPAVQRQDDIPGQHARRVGRRARLHGNDLAFDMIPGIGQTVAGIKGEGHRECEHEVHERPGKQRDQALPGLLQLQRAGILPGDLALRIVLPVKAAVTAARDQAENILRSVLSRPAEKPRAEADAEGAHGNAAGAGGQEMSALVHGHHDAQHQKGQQNRNNR